MTNHKGNKLQNETSPYLLQHAYNPVNWYPWGEEALARAKAEDKPILVSIGYSACHWCHVMERESFENEATALVMNEHFINIKIDREERPDLDHIYMDAVQAMTGGGGWPLNVFLTPGKQPFYGGTYFPPQRAHNRSSWIEVLEGVSKAYREKKADILAQAETLTGHLNKSNSFGLVQAGEEAEAQFFSASTLNTIAENLLKQADTTDGGFGNTPKFPQSSSIIYLLRHYHFTGNETALAQALLSLDKMIMGGIYDQLGGGFARYSTDARWLAPHFEKMLYDNALLITAIAEAWQITGKPQYQKTIEHTLQFVDREMTSPENGFYSALDADSEGIEGKFYTWTRAELEAILEKDTAFFCEWYQIEEAGNWPEGKHEELPTNICHTSRFPSTEEQEQINTCIQKLMVARDQRIRPLLDDKILLGWNAMMITACCKAYAALVNEQSLQMAVKNIQFLENRFCNQETGLWNHTFKNGLAKIPAFLDDYAFLIQAYIHLQEITGNPAYLLSAKKLTGLVIAHFTEPETGFFYYTPDFQTDVIMRKKEVYDGATPSGNAIMVENLQYLSVVFDVAAWKKLAIQLMVSLENAILKHPTSFAVWAASVQKEVIGVKEIVIAGQQAHQYLYQVQEKYLPNKIVQCAETNFPGFPLLHGKRFESDQVLFYLCKNYTCGPAFTSVEDFLANV